jgi:hypothetical protein
MSLLFIISIDVHDENNKLNKLLSEPSKEHSCPLGNPRYFPMIKTNVKPLNFLTIVVSGHTPIDEFL